MNGLQLREARQLRRTELRRIESVIGFKNHLFLALDAEDLARRASLDDPSAHGAAVKRRLMLTAMAAAGIPDAVVAAAWNTTAKQIAAWRGQVLIDTTGIAASIERQVLDELPETDEPGRFVDVTAGGPYSMPAGPTQETR